MRTSCPRKDRSAASAIRNRIEREGERLWRPCDFRHLPFTAVAQTLSRLARSGSLQRLSKGLYYRSRPTPFGLSRPNVAAIQRLAATDRDVFPSGIAAANLLGFTSQNASMHEVATSALSLPRKLIGQKTIVHARRPMAWHKLTEEDAAILDFLRRRGATSELSPQDTVSRLLSRLAEAGRFERIVKVAESEPPRVRAMLGAIGERLDKNPKTLQRLKAGLNPFSRFDFGALWGLDIDRHWQAKGRRTHETI